MENLQTKGIWRARCYDPQGNLKWEDNWTNIVVNEGLDYSLGVALNGSTQTTTWYLGITAGNPTTDATDTMSSHSGWTEVTAYDETDRQTWTPGSVSGQSVDNSGTPATFTGNTDGTTVGGAFLVSDSTKGGTSGTLFSVGAFSVGNKTLDSGDILQVTAEYSTSSS